jgi:hypothetical protein
MTQEYHTNNTGTGSGRSASAQKESNNSGIKSFNQIKKQMGPGKNGCSGYFKEVQKHQDDKDEIPESLNPSIRPAVYRAALQKSRLPVRIKRQDGGLAFLIIRTGIPLKLFHKGRKNTYHDKKKSENIYGLRLSAVTFIHQHIPLFSAVNNIAY